jgi:formate-dependent nitrite reductase membrane component NrfD
MSERDDTPALGTRGEPASWRRASANGGVPLARPEYGDARWSYLFGEDTAYAQGPAPEPGATAAANLRMRYGAMPESVHGPVIHAPVWTWEVPVYFWLGGLASGASFVGFAADLVGDERSAAVARRVAFGAVAPAPLLLIADLGRPARFLNMLRIFKPRSPMNAGAWCLVAFSATGAGAVGADLLGARRAAARLGAAQALLGCYLGSYTGVLLATTAVPVWSRSRAFLGPLFIATGTATGAAATRLALAAAGRRDDDPAVVALARVADAAMLSELALSAVNESGVGSVGAALRREPLFGVAKALVGTGLVLPLIAPGGRRRRSARHTASVLYLAGGLAYRFAWVRAGKASARDDEAVARTARGERWRRAESHDRVARPDTFAPGRAWSGTVGRVSLRIERGAVRVARARGARRASGRRR